MPSSATLDARISAWFADQARLADALADVAMVGARTAGTHLPIAGTLHGEATALAISTGARCAARSVRQVAGWSRMTAARVRQASEPDAAPAPVRRLVLPPALPAGSDLAECEAAVGVLMAIGARHLADLADIVAEAGVQARVVAGIAAAVDDATWTSLTAGARWWWRARWLRGPIDLARITFLRAIERGLRLALADARPAIAAAPVAWDPHTIN
jgi:hypothetical protein